MYVRYLDCRNVVVLVDRVDSARAKERYFVVMLTKGLHAVYEASSPVLCSVDVTAAA